MNITRPIQKSSNDYKANGSKHLFFQPKLTVNNPNDKYEQEADEMADTVMRMTSNEPGQQPFFKPAILPVQRKCTACEEEEKLQRQEDEQEEEGPVESAPIADIPVQKKCVDCEQEEKEEIARKPLSENISGSVQTKTKSESSVNGSVSSAIQNSLGTGSDLDRDTRSFMENRFGADFSEVKIHTGSDAVQMSSDLNAQAFTVGRDVYFNDNKYQPQSDSGKSLLAHELTHVLQQGNKTDLIQKQDQEEPQADHSIVVIGHGIELRREGNGVYADIVWWAIASDRGIPHGPLTEGQAPPQFDPYIGMQTFLPRLENWVGLTLLPGSRSQLIPQRLTLRQTDPYTYVTTIPEADLRTWFGQDRWQMFLDGQVPRPASGDGGDETAPGSGAGGTESGQATEPGSSQGPPARENLDQLDSAFNAATGGNANYPAFPAQLIGPNLLPPDSLGTFKMDLEYSVVGHPLLEIAERLNHVSYHWESFDLTGIVEQGFTPEAAEARGRQTPVSEEALVSPGAATGRRARQSVTDFVEDTERSAETLIDPVGNTPSGDIDDIIGNAISSRVGLGLTLPSAIVTAGGIALDAIADQLGGYSQEREIPLPAREGYYLIRCFATPSPRGRNGEIIRASSMATKVVEVRSTRIIADNALQMGDARIEEKRLELETARRQEPPDTETILRLERELAGLESMAHGIPVDSINAAIQEKNDALQHATGRTRRQLEEEIRQLEELRDFAATRQAELSGTVYRINAVLVSELTGQTYTLLLQLGRINTTRSRQTFRISDVTSRDGKQYQGRGSTPSEAVWAAARDMAQNNEYGRGSLVFRLPADSPFDPKTNTFPSTPGVERIALQRLEHLATVLIVASLFVPGVGEVAAVLGAGLAAHRLAERYENGTLRLDASSINDVISILGAVAQGAVSIGRMRVFAAEGRFVTALESADEAALRTALRDLRSATGAAAIAAATERIIDLGGLIIGTGFSLVDLARLDQMERDGTISHAEARRQRAMMLTSALRDGLLRFGNHGTEHGEATSPEGRRVTPVEIPAPVHTPELPPVHPADTPPLTHPETGVVPPLHPETTVPTIPHPDTTVPTTPHPDTVVLPPETGAGHRESTDPLSPSTQHGTPLPELHGNERVRAHAESPDGQHHIMILDDGRIIRCSAPNCHELSSRFEAFLLSQHDSPEAQEHLRKLRELTLDSQTNSRNLDQATDPEVRRRLEAEREGIARDTAVLEQALRNFANGRGFNPDEPTSGSLITQPTPPSDLSTGLALSAPRREALEQEKRSLGENVQALQTELALTRQRVTELQRLETERLQLVSELHGTPAPGAERRTEIMQRLRGIRESFKSHLGEDYDYDTPEDINEPIQDLNDDLESLGRRISERQGRIGNIEMELHPEQYRAPLPCFSGDTLVWTPHGKIRIDNLKAGDEVYSFDLENKVAIPTRAAHVHKNKTLHFYEIVVDGSIIKATGEHPFYEPVEKRWMSAKEIKPGTLLQSIDNRQVKVQDVIFKEIAEAGSYNISIENIPNYFVGPGILVHNQTPVLNSQGAVDVRLGGTQVVYGGINPEYPGKVYIGRTDQGIITRQEGHRTQAQNFIQLYGQLEQLVQTEGSGHSVAKQRIYDALLQSIGRQTATYSPEAFDILTTQDKPFFEFMQNVELKPLVVGLATLEQARFLEQTNITLERDLGQRELVNRREESVTSLPELQEVVRQQLQGTYYCP